MNWRSIHKRQQPQKERSEMSKKKTYYAPTRSYADLSKNQSTILPQSWFKETVVLRKPVKPVPYIKKVKYVVTSEWVQSLKKEISKMIACVKNYSKIIQGEMQAMQLTFTKLIKEQLEEFTTHDISQSRISSIREKEQNYERDYTYLPINVNNSSMISEKFHYSSKQRLKTQTNEVKKQQEKKALNRTLSHGADFTSYKKMQKLLKQPEKEPSMGSISFYRGKNHKINDSMESLNNCIVSMKKLVRFQPKNQ